MKNSRKSISCILVLMFIACTAVAVLADDDPPSRAARINRIIGQVSIQPAGVEDWALAANNRPLTTGDNVWGDQGASAEFHIGSAAMRIGSETSLTLTNLSDNMVQLGLNQGTLNLHIKHIFDGETYEVDTPNLAFTVFEKGNYRFDVDPNGDTTVVTVWNGSGQATGDGPAVDLGSQQQARFTGGRSLQNQISAAPGLDSFDEMCRRYDEIEDRSPSARYVSPDVIGYEDLDANGQWRDDPQYGHLWVPAGVEAGWAPYHSGHWAWVAPWGWTWVDDAPWGFAPFHYGRWVSVGGVWAWSPGPLEVVAVRPVYAPALVAWVGGVGIGVGGGVGVGWFALGWGEPFIPAYAVSRNYFQTVNVTNTRIVNITNVTNNYYVNNTTIINNTTINNIHYANRTVPGAVVVVPKESMGTAQPVSRMAVKVTPQQLQSAKPMVIAPVAPDKQAVLGTHAGQPAKAPPAKVLSRPLIAKTPPPPPPVTFASKQAALAKNPGQPLSPQTEAQVRKVSPPPATRPAPVIVKSSGAPAPGKAGMPSGQQPKPGAASTPPPAKPPVPQPPKPGTPSAPPPSKPPAPKPPPVPPEHAAPPARTAPPEEKAAPEHAAPPRPPEPPKPAPKPPEHQAAPEHAVPPAHPSEPKPAPKAKPAEKPEKDKEKG